MARTKKQVVVAVPANEKVADMLLEYGKASGHLEESIFLGLTYTDMAGKRILNARKSLSEGFTVTFKQNLQQISVGVEKQSEEAQAIFNNILKAVASAAQEGAELVDDRAQVASSASFTTKQTRMVFNAFDK
jgi:hypothetical protein